MEREAARRKAALALLLATVAGFVDAIGFIVLRGLFTAHMSGNSAQLGVHLGRGDLRAALPLAVAVGLFVAGCALGGTISELARRRGVASRDALILGPQAVLIATFMIYGDLEIGSGRVPDHRLAGFYALAALAIVAIGLQAAALSRVGGRSVRTAYISGVLTNLGQALSLHALRPSGECDRPALGETALLGGIVVVYLAGATVGALLHRHIGIWAMALPLALLIGAVAEDLRRPFEPA